MWEISKSFSFCYGHRVWTQKLNNKDYSMSTECKCRHLHGHEGLVKVFLTSDKLDSGMVTDFHNLGWLKNFLDTYLDHKFVVDTNDPALKVLLNGELVERKYPDRYNNPEFSLYNYPYVLLVGMNNTLPIRKEFHDSIHFGYSIMTDDINDPIMKEYYNSFLLVDFVPTSENFAKWLYDIVQAKMSLIGVDVHSIEWNETPKSRAVYSKPKCGLTLKQIRDVAKEPVYGQISDSGCENHYEKN